MEKRLLAKKPMKLISDGLHAYHQAFNREFYRMANPR